ICGTFMGGIAVIARQAGYRVTGCDANVYPPMSTQLQEQGIELIEGFGIEQLELKPDVFVIGNVVSRGNPLMEEIRNRNLPYISGPQWLAQNILHDKWVLGVAGTHGKTTTSSMLAWILEYAGLHPGFLIGGVPQNFGVSARLGLPSPSALPRWERGLATAVRREPPLPPGEGWGGELFVIEADEYDTAFFDKRSKFVHYRPRTAILNNLEFDHADIFPDLAAIETQFHHLVRTVPGNGLIVSNGRDAALERVLNRGCWTPVEWFGLHQGWNIDADDTVSLDGEPLGTLQWDLLGDHNRMNALAALATARHAGVPVEQGLAALGNFRNVKRRMEVRGVINGITVYDDFAHHPTAIDTTIAGLRHKIGSSRILAVLEPRSNTMKLGVMKEALPGSLKDADLVFCYGANLGWDAAAALAPLGSKAIVKDDLNQLIEAIAAAVKSGDHVLIMSNGGFGGIHEKLLKRL
ncbi:MAG: UDP-N-acetylmuramate:L-alanyl-gamma-D-glutamyl-meso-diaminopimelate ligase, partial [Nitrosomonadales bacterium]|nr:UDP-N-acetylmuramate:L-alanyl-gamma-D-glutamyl-meso-diaminopimelate ligase [Nitrosomonadales bacterium]